MRGALITIAKRINLIIITAALLVGSGADFVLAIPDNTGLIAHWSYNQSSGTVLTDDSGNGHSGTFAGSPTWSAGKMDNALTFDGTDAVKIGNVTQINGVNKLTLATWIKRSANGSKVLLGKQAANQDVAIEAWSDGKVYFQMSKGSDTYGTLNINDTTWHHVAMVFDGTQTGNANRLKAYVDGVQKTLTFKGTVGTTTTTNTTAFAIGKIGSDYSNGQIDDTWLYARALNQAEIQDLMQPAPPTSDTIAPSVPANLTASPVSQSQINLAWSTSTDNVAVTGYRIYRNGSALATTTNTAYQDSNLTAETAYIYTVRAFDGANNESGDSVVASATTFSPPAPDTIAPTVSLSTPADGATVSGPVSINANASDNVGIAGVKFYANGTQIGSEATTLPYAVSWNT